MSLLVLAGSVTEAWLISKLFMLQNLLAPDVQSLQHIVIDINDSGSVKVKSRSIYEQRQLAASHFG